MTPHVSVTHFHSSSASEPTSVTLTDLSHSDSLTRREEVSQNTLLTGVPVKAGQTLKNHSIFCTKEKILKNSAELWVQKNSLSGKYRKSQLIQGGHSKQRPFERGTLDWCTEVTIVRVGVC